MFELKKCSICGKEFIPAVMHMYKTKKKGETTKIQCSYTCYRKAGGDGGRCVRYPETRNYKKK